MLHQQSMQNPTKSHPQHNPHGELMKIVVITVSVKQIATLRSAKQDNIIRIINSVMIQKP